MPEMTVPPPNQCFAHGPEGSEGPPEASFGPPSAPSVQPTADFGGTDGMEGSGPGSDALVRRFANDGAGGAPGVPGALKAREEACFPDDLKAIAVCGGAAVAAVTTGGAAAIFAGLGCAAAALSAAACHSKQDEAVSNR